MILSRHCAILLKTFISKICSNQYIEENIIIILFCDATSFSLGRAVIGVVKQQNNQPGSGEWGGICIFLRLCTIAVRCYYDCIRLQYDGHDCTAILVPIHHDPIRLATTASRFHYDCTRLTTTHDDSITTPLTLLTMSLRWPGTLQYMTENSIMSTIHHDMWYKMAGWSRFILWFSLRCPEEALKRSKMTLLPHQRLVILQHISGERWCRTWSCHCPACPKKTEKILGKTWFPRRSLHGQYEQLISELRDEYVPAFKNVVRMKIAMFRELLVKIGPRIEIRISCVWQNTAPFMCSRHVISW